MLYLIDNASVTLITGNPVYPTMDWKSVSGIMTPLIMLAISPLLWLVLVAINNAKLKATGHNQMAQLAFKGKY